jgi:hypothetical protein
MTLKDRTFHANDHRGMIETRQHVPSVPLFLRYIHERDGTFYEIRHGLSGRKILEHFIPWR